ncbi:unnamed protein product [Caenorhabditis nigoni]
MSSSSSSNIRAPFSDVNDLFPNPKTCRNPATAAKIIQYVNAKWKKQGDLPVLTEYQYIYATAILEGIELLHKGEITMRELKKKIQEAAQRHLKCSTSTAVPNFKKTKE